MAFFKLLKLLFLEELLSNECAAATTGRAARRVKWRHRGVAGNASP
jgi:hypothetical protein